ncbi:hypothetical protein DVH24_039650 [Malus domestica]|uniref:Uncharacterized protein n=1 Tax=Malus domestica TaxID=3750 RepID=A0A498I466_MALDO|nr:hypothetical protein DVH24_039650 [Malus domestica]
MERQWRRRRGWNFDGFGGNNWDESSSSSSSDSAFAFNRVIQILADGLGDADMEKVPMKLTLVC